MDKLILKKAICALLSVMLCLSVVCACSGSPSDEQPTLPKLVIGVDYYEPFVYRNADGDYAGLDIDLATEVCKQIGYEPEFKHIDWCDKNTLLANGSIDCIWCCFTETGREDEYAWAAPYMNSRQVVAVKTDSDITKISDLRGKRVAVQSTTKADEILSGRSGVRGVVVPELKQLNCLPNIEYMFAAISEGYVDAIAGHELVLREYMKTSSVGLRIVEEPLLEVQIGVAFLLGTHSEIVGKINDAFRLLKNNGFMSRLVSDYGLSPDVYVVNYEED